MKLARVASGLNAAKLLLDQRYLQEFSVLCRTLDELCEDVYFLSIGVYTDDVTDRHREFSNLFFQEEHEVEDNGQLQQSSRATVPRKKIRAYISNLSEDPSTHTSNMKGVGSLLSGYVHAAAPHIYEMLDPRSLEYQLAGITNNDLIVDHQHDYWNYVYRGVVACALATKALCDQAEFDDAFSFLKDFERVSGIRKNW